MGVEPDGFGRGRGALTYKIGQWVSLTSDMDKAYGFEPLGSFRETYHLAKGTKGLLVCLPETNGESEYFGVKIVGTPGEFEDKVWWLLECEIGPV